MQEEDQYLEEGMRLLLNDDEEEEVDADKEVKEEQEDLVSGVFLEDNRQLDVKGVKRIVQEVLDEERRKNRSVVRSSTSITTKNSSSSSPAPPMVLLPCGERLVWILLVIVVALFNNSSTLETLMIHQNLLPSNTASTGLGFDGTLENDTKSIPTSASSTTTTSTAMISSSSSSKTMSNKKKKFTSEECVEEVTTNQLFERFGRKLGYVWDTDIDGEKMLEIMWHYHEDGIPVPIQGYPYLFLGSVGVAYNKESMKATGITHIIDATYDIPNKFPDDFTYYNIRVHDNNDEKNDISMYWDKSNKFIDDAHQNGGKVLVHCYNGKSRSVSTIAAYLMSSSSSTQEEGMTYEDAMELIRTTRPQAHPNSNYRKRLHELEDKGRGKIKRKSSIIHSSSC